MKKFLFLLVAATVLLGCSTELEVNAPYKDITIVYGLLNQREDTHFVKINKAFLGEGDAYQYAAIQDSNEYRDEDITHKMVHRLGTNGQPEASFELFPIQINDRLPGDFYSPEQTVYYFVHPEVVQVNNDVFYLDQNKEYQLDLVVKGKEIKARTTITNDFLISPVNFSPTTVVNFHGPQGYLPYTFRWTTGVDGKRYEVSLRF
nr:hypothetical protein [Bacteroidota bacterium]